MIFRNFKPIIQVFGGSDKLNCCDVGNMRYKCAYLWGTISLLSIVLTIQCFGSSYDINNGSFENFYYNREYDINIPTDWECTNYTAVVGNFIPMPENSQGETTYWRINTAVGLLPFKGEHLLVLSTGNLKGHPSVVNATVWRSITSQAGDKLTGVYFFGTCDYIDVLPLYNDWADIKLTHETDPNKDVNIVYVCTQDMGSYRLHDNGSMSGWKRFEYTFDANHTGNYNLVIGVNDYSDVIYNSYLAVDGLVLCHNPPQFGDFNCDCTVDFQDFALLAADWLCDCNDPNIHNDPQSNPNFYNDPNRNCLLGTNIVGEGLVDYNDLQIMSENWLEGTKQ